MNHSSLVLGAFLICIFSCQHPFVQGERIYEIRCANCHMSDGSGLEQAIPGLNNMQDQFLELDVACIIRKGKPKGRYMAMPSNEDLTEAEITNLINFLRHEFWKDSRFAQPNDVGQVLQGVFPLPVAGIEISHQPYGQLLGVER